MGEHLYTLSQNRGNHRMGGSSPPDPEGWEGNLYPLTKQGQSQKRGRASPKQEAWKGNLWPLIAEGPSHKMGGGGGQNHSNRRAERGISILSQDRVNPTGWSICIWTKGYRRGLGGESRPSPSTGATTGWGSKPPNQRLSQRVGRISTLSLNRGHHRMG